MGGQTSYGYIPGGESVVEYSFRLQYSLHCSGTVRRAVRPNASDRETVTVNRTNTWLLAASLLASMIIGVGAAATTDSEALEPWRSSGWSPV
jgi:hypothetical protein